jgi:hypothetical protein
MSPVFPSDLEAHDWGIKRVLLAVSWNAGITRSWCLAARTGRSSTGTLPLVASSASSGATIARYISEWDIVMCYTDVQASAVIEGLQLSLIDPHDKVITKQIRFHRSKQGTERHCYF